MKEVFTMWRHTQLVVLVALSAAIYAAVLIPFKGFTIVPGYIEIRPANVFPVVFGLLFGPAGAWGSAIGNLIGDFFGTLSLGSVGGFVGNFFLAYLPYKMWSTYFRRDENIETNVNSGKKLGVYLLVTILASVVCAVIISWWISLLGFVPFQAALPLIVFNNAIMAGVLGPLLLLAPTRGSSGGGSCGRRSWSPRRSRHPGSGSWATSWSGSAASAARPWA